MAFTVRTLRWAGTLAAVAMMSVAAFSQQNAQPRSAAPRSALPGSQQQGNAQRITANKLANDGPVTNHDHTIANWLAIGNQAEIAVSQFAESKVEHKDVRKFAEMLAKEHGQLQQQLHQFGASPVRFGEGRERREPSTSQRTSAVNPEAQPQAQGQGQVAADHQMGFRFLEVKREIADRCVATAEKELNDKKGTERDECFVGMQIAIHQEMLNTEKVLRDYATPAFQEVIDKAIETTESHLDHAKHLIRSLANDQRGSDNRRDEK